MNYTQLPLNWFDILAVIFLLLGMRSGRKHGMSEEWLSCIQWLVIIFIGSLAYKPLGDQILKLSPMNRAFCYIAVYLVLAVFTKIIFSKIKESLPEKLKGPSDFFGRYEFYLGMVAGVFRHACILVSILAIVNAPYYSPQEIARSKAMQKDVFGSDFFPETSSIQNSIFKESFIGRNISSTAGNLLIAMNRPDSKQRKKAKDNLP